MGRTLLVKLMTLLLPMPVLPLQVTIPLCVNWEQEWPASQDCCEGNKGEKCCHQPYNLKDKSMIFYYYYQQHSYNELSTKTTAHRRAKANIKLHTTRPMDPLWSVPSIPNVQTLRSIATPLCGNVCGPHRLIKSGAGDRRMCFIQSCPFSPWIQRCMTELALILTTTQHGLL